MFKVECPGCKAPYQVDERRVPASGLKMRCPKCGSSFKVDSPTEGAGPAPAAALGAVLGVNADTLPPPALSASVPARSSTHSGASALKTTMLGVGNPFAAPKVPAIPAAGPAVPAADAAPANLPLAAPAARRGSEPEFDLPAPVAPKPGPNLRPPRAPQPSGDLPPALAPSFGADLPAPAAPKASADLPSPAAPRKGPPPPPGRKGPPPVPPRPTEPALSVATAAAASPPAAAPVVPAPRSPQDSAGLELDLAGPASMDLPSPANGRNLGPTAVAAQQTSRSDALDLDLPSVGGARTFELDLPSVSSAGPKPASNPLASGGFGDIELDLPEAPRASATRPDLPAPRGPLKSAPIKLPSIQAPAPAAGRSSPDLPSLGGGGLPSASNAALPEPVGRSGRGLAGRAPQRSSLSEPSPGASFDDLPVPGGAGLPTPGGFGLPSVGGAGLPVSSATGLPVAGGPSLPTAGGPSLPVSNPPRPPGSLPPFELEPAAPPNSAPGFGELDLPPLVPGSNPAGPSPRFDDGLEADPFGEVALPPPRSLSEPRFGRVGAAGPLATNAAAGPVIRQAGGGTAYGEVNLGDDASAQVVLDAALGRGEPIADEDMEFGGVPQEPARPAAAAVAPVSIPGEALRERAPVSGRALPSAEAPRKLRWRVPAALFAVSLAGASLAFVPKLGPFGAHWILDHVKADEYARQLADTVSSARRELSRDVAPAGNRAAEIVNAAHEQAKRVPGLTAYAAYVASARELRFGADPEIHARAKVLLDELQEEERAPYLELARAARAATEGQLARARQAVGAVLQATPGDPDALLLRAEVELKAHDAAAALGAWKELAARDASARAAFGLGRAAFAAGDAAGAEQQAKLTLQRNPDHIGARILLARIASKTPGRESEAITRLGEVTKKPELASPEERVNAAALLGDIHLSRSRISRAEEAYTEALKINPKAAHALIGLGEALYRAGRYSEAQARFEAGAQAEPDDLLCKVGVAKSKLMLERVEDALASLKKLSESHASSLMVQYWYGRALDASGDRKGAERVYRAAIDKIKEDPLLVDTYVALAQLQSQQGSIAEAGKTLNSARERLPGSATVYRALGDWSLSQGDYGEAQRQFRKALELDPEDLGASFKLGSALRRDNKLAEASAQFDQVAKTDQDYPGLALERGLIFESQGKPEQALGEYQRALAKAPGDPDLMLREGCAYASAELTKEAEGLLRKVLSLRPTSAETNYCLGRALLAEGSRLADALRLLERAVELDPHRPEFYLYVGRAANDAGNVPKADKALAQALALDQNLADAYWQRGVLRQRQGAVVDAVSDLTRALSLRPSLYDAHAALADAYYDLGKEAPALAEWQKAVQGKPDNATWHFRYGSLLLANNFSDNARSELGRALELVEKNPHGERWLWEAHRLYARTLGERPEAQTHWEAFLNDGPRDSPYRQEAKTWLAKHGHPWAGG